MRKKEIFSAILCVFLFVCVIGLAVARKAKKCSGKHDDCTEAGIIPGVQYQIKRKNGYIRRNYFCDVNKALNIDKTEVFECCYDPHHALYMWRSKSKAKFILEAEDAVELNHILKCEEKEPCGQPPEPAANMSRDVVTRYMDTVLEGSTFYDGDTFQYTCPEGFEHVPEEVNEEDVPEEASDGSDDGYSNSYYSNYYNTGDGPGVNLTSLLTCSPQGQWIDNATQSEDIHIGQCREILCDASRFENMTNGLIVNYTSVYQYGEYLELQCDQGYMPRDHVDTVMCETTDSFTEMKLPNFRCQVTQCPIPPNVVHGNAYGVSRVVNGTATFGCDTGYTLSGQKTWHCQENGKWDSTCIRCNRKDTYCSAPCVPEGALLLNPQDTYLEGDVVNFTCEMEVTYGGSSERVCLRNRQWSGDDIDCIGRRWRPADAHRLLSTLGLATLGNTTLPRKDILLMDVLDNEADYDAVNVEGKSIDVNKPGGVDVTLLVDVSGSITDDEFDTTKRFISALLPRLHISPAKTGTRLALYMFASETKEIHNDHWVDINGQIPLSKDEWLDEIESLKRNTIQQKTKKGTGFTKALKTVLSDLQTKQTGWDQRTIRITHQQVLIIISDGQDNMGGDSLRVAEKLKNEYKTEIYAIYVQERKKKNRITGITLMKNIASEKENEKHFFMVNTDTDGGTLDDFVDMMINDGGPGCMECGCTLPEKTKYKSKENQHHTEAVQNAWPWMVQLKRKNNIHHCGGSVINSTWILTAAHCFGKENIDKTQVTSVDFKRRDREDDKGFLTRHIQNPEANVILHEKYNYNKKPDYLYDIALIHLEKDKSLEFDSELHAICLGNRTDPAYYNYLKKDTYGVVTGWGKTNGKNTEFAKLLKQMQMPIQSNETCLNMDKNRNMSRLFNEELMFCAGGKDEDGKIIDTCAGDSGGPFVVPNDDPEKQDHFLQIGIVSFGLGCMQEGKHGIYTKLTPELLKWIDDTIQRVESQA